MADKKRDEDTGRYQTKFTDEDFIEAVESIGPATTQDIREKIGCAYRTAHERLSYLENDDRIKRQKVGQSLLWSSPDPDDE